MKTIKTFLTILAANFVFFAAHAQTQERVAVSSCQCGPGQSTCNSNCIFSDCCVCWNTATQSGSCGCFWGIATCKTGKIDAARGQSTDDNIFGEVHPEARITFHFEKFRKLISFFENKKRNTGELQNAIGSTSSKYSQTDDNTRICNEDFTILLTAYSNLIRQLDESQKNDLNIYIKSL
jgi:hypothetical protein